MVVETEVCNGLSTLSILLALDENDDGKLYSLDYPLRIDESLELYRRDEPRDVPDREYVFLDDNGEP